MPHPPVRSRQPPFSPADLRLLGEVMQSYRQQLGGDDPAGRQFLQKLGIRSRETIEAFRIGYSDGKLAHRVNERQRQDLQRLGLLTHNNVEWTSNALVLPALDLERGVVVDLFAVRHYRNEKVRLRKPGAGLIHPTALKAAEIVVTDWPEAALTLHQAGWKAVLLARSAADITEQAKAIKAARLTRVWVCSAKRGTQLSAVLKSLGCEVRHLKLPNDFRQITTETLRDQMEAAATLQPARPRPLLAHADEAGAVFEQHGVTFTVAGWPEDAGNPKVVLTASKGEARHTDRVDLLSATMRKRFAKQAAEVLTVERGKLEIVLLDLGDDLRALNLDRQRAAREQPGAPVPMAEDRKQAALAMLRNPDLTGLVMDDLATLGLVGERDNALLLYLVAVSRKLNRPLSAILRSESASGKSNLVERIVELLPEEDVLYVSRLSGNALFYMPPDSLRHRLLVVEERQGGEEADYAVRVLQSKGSLTTAIPLPPEEPGVMRTKLITVKGPVAYVETTTAPEIDPQNLNRCFEVRLDESSGQTARIIAERQRRRAATHEKTARESLIERHRDMQRLLHAAPVLIPFARHLTFPAGQVRFRRDHERLLGLIDASAILHQHQRTWRTTPRGEQAILADLADYETAYRLSTRALSLAVDEVGAHARAAWAKISSYKAEPFTRRQLMEALGWPYKRAYLALVELRRHDLLGVKPGVGNVPAQYFAYSTVPVCPELGLIPPEALAPLFAAVPK